MAQYSHSQKHPLASRTLLASALAATIAGITGTAQAQDTLEEVVITGSRIRMTGMETPTPVTAVDAQELTNMAPGNMIDSLSQLPQFLNNSTPQTQFNFGGSAGASNLNLRGVGPQRTLVLLDGRRVTPSSRSNTVDINLFPDAMIRRVETVTGGASAAYGTDAVAGVVNFILDTDFTGVAANLQAGTTSRSDGDNWEGSFSFGTDIGTNSHLLFSAAGFQQDGIDGYDGRDWYQGWGTVTNPAWQAAVNAGDCSLNVLCDAGPQLIRAPQVVSTQYTFGGMTVSPVAALNNLHFLSDGSAIPFQFSNLGTQTGTLSQSVHPAFGGGSGDNYEADRGGEGGLSPNIDRQNAFLYLDHDLSDTLSVYGQVVYGSSTTNAPGFTSLQLGGWQATIYQDNAFLPEGLRQTMIDNNVDSIGLSSLRSSADLGQARFEQENTMTSGTVGFKSEITGGWFDGWSLDGYYQFGQTDSRIRLMDFARIDRLFLAMDAVTTSSGSIQCRAAVFNPEQYGNCVPLNMLGAGRASPEAIAYALGRDDGTNLKVQAADLEQEVIDLAMSGEVFDGWGAGAVSAAFGVAYREDSIVQRIHDVTNPSNDQSMHAVPVNDPSKGIQGIPGPFAGTPTGYQFSGAQNFDGKIIVSEAFGEFLVPLVADLPFVQQLNASLAARWADYSGSGNVWSWKYGADWMVNDAVRLRGTVSRDVRAGSLSERFDQQRQGASGADPFRGGETYAFSQTIGGNANIEPEKALTWTAGIVYQPQFLDGLSISADYYEITTKGLIAQLGVTNIINQCYAGSASQCANITRGPASADPQFGVGLITGVFNGFQNIGEAVVSGADLEIAYRTDIDWFGGGESLAVRAFYSYLEENSIDSDPGNPLTDTKIEQAGDISLALPRNQLTMNASYMNGPLTLFVQERYIGAGNHSNVLNGVSVTEGVQINDNKVAAAYYTDLNLTWTIEQNGGGTLDFFANVTNVFDRTPPIRGAFFNFFGSTQQVDALHDILGRRYTAGVRMRF